MAREQKQGLELQVEVVLPEGGGAEIIMASMNEWERNDLARRTLVAVRRARQDPAIWAMVKAKEAQLRAEGFFDQIHYAGEGG